MDCGVPMSVSHGGQSPIDPTAAAMKEKGVQACISCKEGH